MVRLPDHLRRVCFRAVNNPSGQCDLPGCTWDHDTPRVKEARALQYPKGLAKGKGGGGKSSAKGGANKDGKKSSGGGKSGGDGGKPSAEKNRESSALSTFGATASAAKSATTSTTIKPSPQ